MQSPPPEMNDRTPTSLNTENWMDAFQLSLCPSGMIKRSRHLATPQNPAPSWPFQARVRWVIPSTLAPPPSPIMLPSLCSTLNAPKTSPVSKRRPRSLGFGCPALHPETRRSRQHDPSAPVSSWAHVPREPRGHSSQFQRRDRPTAP